MEWQRGEAGKIPEFFGVFLVWGGKTGKKMGFRDDSQKGFRDDS